MSFPEDIEYRSEEQNLEKSGVWYQLIGNNFVKQFGLVNRLLCEKPHVREFVETLCPHGVGGYES